MVIFFRIISALNDEWLGFRNGIYLITFTALYTIKLSDLVLAGQ